MTNSTRKWIRAGAEAFITGLTSGPAASITGIIIDPKTFGPNLKSLELFSWTALISGGFRFWHWWGTHPLPPEDDTQPPFPGVGPTISMNPMTKVIAVPIEQVQPTVQPHVQPPKP